MIVSINNAIQQTAIFTVVLAVVFLFFSRRRSITEWFPSSLTVELKGLAILMIVLSHIGYFLVNDHEFLWPLSIMAGVGVNLFLFLSGYGLTASQLKTDLAPGQFYKRRLPKLFLPFWLMFIVLLVLDFFVLRIDYSWQFISQAAVGIFTQADVYGDFNSPLWYFTLIFGYYLVYPLVFLKKWPWLSAIILYLLGYFFVYFKPEFFSGVFHLHKIHLVAFPSGVLVAWAISKLPSADVLVKWSRGRLAVVYYLALAAFLALALYFIANPALGTKQEEWASLAVVMALALVFMLKKIEFRLFYWLGLYSYEIYLWHWPIMYRYDFLYRFVPAWLATLLYLAFFVGLALLAAKLTDHLTKRPVAIKIVNNK